MEDDDLPGGAAPRPHRCPWLLDGPLDGDSLRTHVEAVVVPTLEPGDIVLMDEPASHKGKAVRQAIRSPGAKVFFLPKSSPDLNPIEQGFAKLKHPTISRLQAMRPQAMTKPKIIPL